MKVTYHGHSCFFVETSKARLIIDPFISENPNGYGRVDNIKCEYVLLSHGHEDHTGDALAIAKANNAVIVAAYELAEHFGLKGAKFHGMNPGGGWNFPFGRVKLTIAHHSSSEGAGRAGFTPVYLGNPCGIIVEADGKRLYHAGDTALFLEMQLIGRGGLDAALLPIGDNYTMGPEDAIDALDMLKPKICVPMHYNTWPPIAQDAGAFAKAAATRGHKVAPLKPGESLQL